MLKFWNYDIVFQEVPDETTLAINITNCPNHCEGCHSKHLWKDEGVPLDDGTLGEVLKPYLQVITCVCFMGGDGEPAEVNRLAASCRERFAGLRVAWYSGKQMLSESVELKNFDYIKLGPYVESKGALKSPNTNQRLYRVKGAELEDITSVFWRKRFD